MNVSVAFTDEDADLPGGLAEIGLKRAAEPKGRLFEVPLEGERATSGTLEITVRLPPGLVPGSYDLSVTLVDRAGRRSNPLVGSFLVLD